MAAYLHGLARSESIIAAYALVGMFINSLLHLYRFHKVGWTQVTGLWGQAQSMRLSWALACWAVILLVFSKYLMLGLKRSRWMLMLVPLALLIINEASGRSVLKLAFDILLVAVLYVWLAIDHGYGHYLSNPPAQKAFSFVVTELMTIFQISLAILTFVIATFGFSFAPNYIEKSYHQDIGQPTVWWFAVMTMYLTLGIVGFVSAHAWVLATRLRATLE